MRTTSLIGGFSFLIAFGLVTTILPRPWHEVAAIQAAEFTVEASKDGATVKLDGRLVAEYRTFSGHEPILWPVLGPTGKEMTRGWPMRDDAGATHDHPHQRSFWFTHGKVNGIDFWSEAERAGKIRQRGDFLELRGGSTGRIVAQDDWIGPDGAKVCEDRRTLVFRAAKDERTIDFNVVVTASHGPLVFGDTKEGSFGLRIADSMRVDSKQGGRIVNSEGRTDTAAWGQRAAWVDYQGPVDGQTLGIAILNHPTSYGYPTFWHVRTYGLFAANPFGRKDFEPSAGRDGSLTIEPGRTLELRYRVILHHGDEKSAHLAEAFAAYARETRESLDSK
jgi:hypothetical protein